MNRSAHPLRVGVVGLGAMGRNHLRVLRSFPDVKVAVLVDPDPAISEIAAQVGCAYAAGIDQVDLNAAAEAIIVAAPTLSHGALCNALLDRGIPMLVEKPLAVSYAEAAGLAERAARTQTLVAVGHIERHNPVVAAARAMLESGSIGEIACISARRLGLAPPSPIGINTVILDIAIHDLDIICWLYERQPQGLLARAGRAWDIGSYDFADILMDFGGPTGHVQANWLTPVRVRTLSITGIGGYAELDYINQRLVLYRHHASPTGSSFAELRALSKSIVPEEIKVAAAEPLERELRNFVNAVRGLEEAACKAQDGAAAVRLAELAVRSCGLPFEPSAPFVRVS